MTFHATVLTLYPEMFPGPLGASLSGKALEAGLWSLKVLDIRDFASNKHRTVDDTPAGGGPGMVMRVDVLGAAVEAALGQQPALSRFDAGNVPQLAAPVAPLIAMSPRGRPLSQEMVRSWAGGPGVVIVCGRFEGMDERLFEVPFGGDGQKVEPVSVGDYVLSGGELGAMVTLDACVRLLPGVMGADASGAEESFEGGLLEYPQYTRPREWRGHAIPDVLLSGNHKRIAAWREAERRDATRLRRPDLWATHEAAAAAGRHGQPPSGAQKSGDRAPNDKAGPRGAASLTAEKGC